MDALGALVRISQGACRAQRREARAANGEEPTCSHSCRLTLHPVETTRGPEEVPNQAQASWILVETLLLNGWVFFNQDVVEWWLPSSRGSHGSAPRATAAWQEHVLHNYKKFSKMPEGKITQIL